MRREHGITRDLAITCDGLDSERLLTDWRWLVPSDATPLLIGIFGDWIFGGPDGSHWHLGLLEGQFQQIAKDSVEFNTKKREEKFRDEWFNANWADIALGNDLVPDDTQCLGWEIAPILGGSFSVDNLRVFDLFVCQSFHGQLFRQISQQT